MGGNVEVWYRDEEGRGAVFQSDSGKVSWTDSLCVIDYVEGDKAMVRCFPIVNIVYVQAERVRGR